MIRWIALALLLGCPLVASAAVDAHDFELTLGGTGISGSKLDGVTAAGNVSVGYYLTRDFEISVRQALSYSDIGVSGNLDGSTRLAIDYHLNFGDADQWRPFVGLNGGYVYGDDVTDTFEIAPEVGLKYYIKPDAFLFGQLEYQYFTNQGSGNGGFNDGEYIVTFGIGLEL